MQDIAPGSMVACFRVKWRPGKVVPLTPEVGCIYTVAKYWGTGNGNPIGEPLISLEEIPPSGGCVHWWSADCFHPVPRTNIEDLRQLLEPTPERKSVET